MIFISDYVRGANHAFVIANNYLDAYPLHNPSTGY